LDSADSTKESVLRFNLTATRGSIAACSGLQMNFSGGTFGFAVKYCSEKEEVGEDGTRKSAWWLRLCRALESKSLTEEQIEVLKHANLVRTAKLKYEIIKIICLEKQIG